MNIILCGYGRMGKAIASLVAGEDSIVQSIDPRDPEASAQKLLPEHRAQADVVIEFSHPDAVKQHLAYYSEHGIPAVVGTTGWNPAERLQEMQTLSAPYIWASNYSIGAYILSSLATHLAQCINNVPDYDIMLHEYHHRLKQDSPSGTALSIAQAMLAALDRKTNISSESLQAAISPETLHVTATRGGTIPGTHTITADSSVDSIAITHTARNRNGFALGALYAARWICTKEPGFYTIDDCMRDILSI